MARPQKKGLDYFPFDVGFFDDWKIKELRGKFGWDAVIIYQYILCHIYKDNGYYLQFADGFKYVMAADLNMSSNKIGQIINFLCERSLLNGTLFASDKVLTSRGIQLRFQEAVKSRATKTEITVGKYWLLSESETQSYIKCTDFQNYSKKNDNFSKNNNDFSEKKPHKEKKSKEEKSKENSIEALAERIGSAALIPTIVPTWLIECYQNNISRNYITPIELDNLEFWCGRVEPDVVKYAIGEAVSHNVTNWSYIKRILENHYNAGRTTLDAVRSAMPNRKDDTVFGDNGVDYDELEKIMRSKM